MVTDLLSYLVPYYSIYMWMLPRPVLEGFSGYIFNEINPLSYQINVLTNESTISTNESNILRSENNDFSRQIRRHWSPVRRIKLFHRFLELRPCNLEGISIIDE